VENRKKERKEHKVFVKKLADNQFAPELNLFPIYIEYPMYVKEVNWPCIKQHQPTKE
jgi:hypothetical protein